MYQLAINTSLSALLYVLIPLCLIWKACCWYRPPFLSPLVAITAYRFYLLLFLSMPHFLSLLFLVFFRSYLPFLSFLCTFSYFLVVLAYPILAIYSAYIYKALLIQDAAFRRFVRGLIRRVLSLVYSLSAFLQWAANSNLKPKREYLIVFLQRPIWLEVSLRYSRCSR